MQTLDALTPLLRATGSGADIPFVTCPVGLPNIPSLYPNTGSAWTRYSISLIGTMKQLEFFITEKNHVHGKREQILLLLINGVYGIL